MAAAASEIPVVAQDQARDQAFEQLYERYVKDVYHYALALLRNPADAEDVTQTTFMNAYRAIKQGVEPIKPHNWLIKIAHNAARSRYAHASRRVKEVPLEDHVEQLAVPDQERPNVEGILRELGRLPFNQRAALVMRELEGRSYPEIADTLEVSVSAVETLIFRARKSLRLRASAIKALSIVPLPTSLTQLFESGGVVTGGSALVGSGLLIKAAVALVAGAVATGIGGDHARRADAAASLRPQVSSSVLRGMQDGSFDRRFVNGRLAKGIHAAGRQVVKQVAASRGEGGSGAGRLAEQNGGAAAIPAGAPEARQTSPSPSATANPLTSAVDQATKLVPAPPLVTVPQLPPAPAVPSIPVQVPPVQLPPPPPVPTLP